LGTEKAEDENAATKEQVKQESVRVASAR
jgi:hypothetical protein